VLNDTQTRRISVRLSRVATDARDLVEQIDQVCLASDDAAAAAYAPLRSELESLLASVERAAEALGVSIAPPDPDLRHRIGTWAATAWVSLADCLPERLTGAGPLAPETAPVLSEAIGRVTRQLERIRSLGA